MRRSAPFAAVVLFLLAASFVLLLPPILTCPDCGDAMGVHRRNVAMPSFVNLGCPRCDDSGKVSGWNRWTRRRLDADLVDLILGAWKDELGSQDEFEAPLLRLAARSGLQLDLEDSYYGQAVFVDDGKDGILAASVRGRDLPGTPSRWTLLLFDRDGAVLDQLRFSCLNPPSLGLTPLWSTGSIDWRSFGFWSGAAGQFTFVFQRGAEETRILAPSLRFRARDGRFEVDP